MADLQFVDFALMLGPIRKEKQFRLPDNLSKVDVTIFSQTSHPVSSFPAVFHNADGSLFSDLQNVLHKEGESRNFNVSAFRGRKCRLLATVM